MNMSYSAGEKNPMFDLIHDVMQLQEELAMQARSQGSHLPEGSRYGGRSVGLSINGGTPIAGWFVSW